MAGLVASAFDFTRNAVHRRPRKPSATIWSHACQRVLSLRSGLGPLVKKTLLVHTGLLRKSWQKCE